ncbi:MAG: tyrosine--tRNA ligase [Chloroflexi bacterium]|nr:tyrosine--tRNA ligase [Chloroflexota bacterium]
MAPVEDQLAALLRGTEFGDEPTRRVMEAELRERLAEGRPLRVYCGYDPTAVDLHLGHTLTMRKLRTFQDLGHEVTFLIGNFTTLVGDPSDADRTRPMLSPEEIEENSRTYVDQAFRILDRERTIVRRNADWLGALSFGDVLRVASHFTVAQFLERDNLARRFERHDPIHISEFLYALMQAYDAVAMETDVQVGGSDQLFNLMAGRVLQREYGQRPQVAITLPLLSGTDGNLKMSKSLGNHIGIDEPPNDLFGKVMSIPDSSLRSYFTLLTDLPDVEVEALLAGAPMEAKKRLALEITAGLHGSSAAEAARGYFESTIQRRETPSEMPEYALDGEAPEGERSLLRVLAASGLAASSAEARRLVAQGAVRVNGERALEAARPLSPGDELRVGPRRFLRVVAGAGRGA